ncbi:MAG: response regulator [Jannaschia sp.]
MFTGRRIALVEDDEIMGASIAQRLALEGADVVWHKQAVRALGAIRTPRGPIDAVVCDIRLPDGTGEDVFRALCRTASPPPFLFITGQGDVAQAVRLLKAGAADYVTKPFEMRGFLDRLAQIVGPIFSEGEGLLGVSAAARETEGRIAQAARGAGSTLLLGEPGTSKRRLARRLHDLSGRDGLFDWNPLVEPLSADAVAARAADGTLFVASLDVLAPKAQDVLVHLIDESHAFRLVATGPTQLAPSTEGGMILPELWGRLVAGSIAVPPLRRRTEDALWLARRIFESVNARRPTPLRGFSALAETALLDHDWPGNGREVRTRTVRAVSIAPGEWLFPVDLFPERQEERLLPLSEARDAAERAHIGQALERSGGQMAGAARLLAISRTTLWEKIQKLGL